MITNITHGDNPKIQIKRHERISNFYHGELNDYKQTLLAALGFKDYQEALSWFAHEFSTKDLDWTTSKHEEIQNAGSPYPKSLPNAVRIAEIGSMMTLEMEIASIWETLTSAEQALVNLNYKHVFGFPSLVQGDNTIYCRGKYKKWLAMNKLYK